MTEREALRTLGLQSLPADRAVLTGAMTQRTRAAQVRLQITSGHQARERIIEEMKRLKEALDLLLKLVGTAPTPVPAPPWPTPLPGPNPITPSPAPWPVPRPIPRPVPGPRPSPTPIPIPIPAPRPQPAPASTPRPLPARVLSKMEGVIRLSLRVLCLAGVFLWQMSQLTLHILRSIASFCIRVLKWGCCHPLWATSCLVVIGIMASVLLWLDKNHSATAFAEVPTMIANVIVPGAKPPSPVPDETEKEAPEIGSPRQNATCAIRFLTFPAADVFVGGKYICESPGPSTFSISVPQMVAFECRAKDGSSFSFTETLTSSKGYVFKVDVCQKKYTVEAVKP